MGVSIQGLWPHSGSVIVLSMIVDVMGYLGVAEDTGRHTGTISRDSTIQMVPLYGAAWSMV